MGQKLTLYEIEAECLIPSSVNRTFIDYCVAEIFQELLKVRCSSSFQTILHDFTRRSA